MRTSRRLLQTPLLYGVAIAASACAPPGDATEEAVVEAYALYAEATSGALDVDVTLVERIGFEELKDEDFGEVLHVSGRYVQAARTWDYTEGCARVTVTPTWKERDADYLDNLEGVTVADALHYAAMEGDLPAVEDLAEISVFEVRLAMGDEHRTHRSIALDYVTGEHELLDYTLTGINGFRHRIEREDLCSSDATAPAKQRADKASCSPSGRTVTINVPSHTKTGTCGGTDVADATYKFSESCSSSCLHVNSPSLPSTTCVADDGCWNSWDDTDTDIATHGCSTSNGNACTASAAFHCVTKHCPFPVCNAKAKVSWNGIGFEFGPGSGALNATMEWHHESRSCE